MNTFTDTKDDTFTKNEAEMGGKELVDAQKHVYAAVMDACRSLQNIFLSEDHLALCAESQWLLKGAHSRLEYILKEDDPICLALARRAGKLNGNKRGVV